MSKQSYKTIDQCVGGTPLVRLQRLNPNPSNIILGKLEGNNPAGSVKDRAALKMISEAENRGEIHPNYVNYVHYVRVYSNSEKITFFFFYILSECGYFLTKVNYVNNRINKNFIHVNSGLNHFIRPMFYGSKHSIENISSNSEEIKNYSVVGYICETDTFS